MIDPPEYSAAELAAARYAELSAKPTSREAIALCKSLATGLLHQRRKKPTGKQEAVLGALVADLLERDPEDNGGWLYRSLAAGSFTGDLIGYRPFMAVYEPMKGMMIEAVGGTGQWTVSEFTGGNRQPSWQRAARFRATKWLRDWFAEQGITRKNWADHFQRQAQTITTRRSPVSLRAKKSPRAKEASMGRRLAIDLKAPEVQAIIERMNSLNEFLSQQTVEPFGPVFLRRTFNNGDQPDFAWDQGGRLNALGQKTYQTAKKKVRATIAINGEKTKELDIRACHLTILVGLGQLPSSVLDGDPYSVEGIPREVVKQWVTMTLGHGKRHTRWSPSARANLKDIVDGELGQAYPIRQTGDLILQRLPLIDEGGSTVGVGWAELQFRESEILLEAMEVLAFDHSTPSLPIHDSLIVPLSGVELATRVLKDTFQSHVGVEPTVT